MNRKALIVGASGGIGSALYLQLRDTHRVFAISGQTQEFPDWFVSDYSENSLKEIAREIDCRFDLVFICNGFLHNESHAPEKRLSRIEPDAMHTSYERNVVIPAMVLRYFYNHFYRERPTVCALLSARVGSIGDNRTGGWYSYRCAKATLNMLVKTSATELERTYKHLTLVALHPGTTQSALSAPFLRQGSHRWVSADETAQNLERVATALDPTDTGRFYDWRGEPVEW